MQFWKFYGISKYFKENWVKLLNKDMSYALMQYDIYKTCNLTTVSNSWKKIRVPGGLVTTFIWRIIFKTLYYVL